MAAEHPVRTYRLEPLDTSGVFVGLGVVQCCLLGSGITLAVLMVTSGAPLPVAALPVAGAMAASFARIGARPAWEWVPLGAGWLWVIVRRGRRWAAPLPLLPVDAVKPAPLPACLAGLDVVEVTWRSQLRLGAVRDHECQTLTALVPVVGAPFVMEPDGEQERLLAGWGDVLGQFAVDSLVAHVFWSDLSHPSGLRQHLAWLDGDERGDSPVAAAESYRVALEQAAAGATTHEVVVGITVTADRLRRKGRRGGSSEEHLRQGLVTAVEALLRGLRAAGLTAADPLEAMGVHRLLRQRIDPVTESKPAGHHGRLVDRLGLVTPASSGPLMLEAAWGHVRVDGAWHRTWWVGCWPRLAVPPSWLEPFLSGGGAIARTMTVVLVPISGHQSRRRIERDLVKLDSDAATKEDKGRRIDARHRRATETLLDREQELVAGYAEVAYVGLVGVAASSEDELDEQSAIVEQLAREAGMELRVLDGRQDVAWAAALPLGLAPKTLVAT